MRAQRNGPAANDDFETVTPRRPLVGVDTVVLELTTRGGAWVVLARWEGASLCSSWRIVDPSGIELLSAREPRGLAHPRSRSRVPPWVARAFDRVRPVSVRPRMVTPILTIDDRDWRAA
jgi:hypothetical protein